MKTLVAWDDPREAELLALYLTLGTNEARFCPTPAELFRAAAAECWDVVLLAQTFPVTADECFAVFQKLQELRPEVPVVLGCRPDELLGLPRFLMRGLRSYIVRDDRGDFIFLLLVNLESTVAAVRAERSRQHSERLRQELDGVRRLQEAIIPCDLRVPPGYRAAARHEPSEAGAEGDRTALPAGGDFYDIVPIDPGTLVSFVGDTSSHGLKACLAVLTLHTLIRMVRGERYRDTAGFVAAVNRQLCDTVTVPGEGGFITLFYAALDTARHQLTWTSAGSPRVLLHDRLAGTVRSVGTAADGGLPLGVSSDTEYTSATIELPPGARVLIFSDGLTGVTAALCECHDRPPEDTLAHLFAQSRGAGRHEDASVVLVEREGA